jgi:hypothetical protein
MENIMEKQIAEPIKALSFDQENNAADCGKRFAKNKQERIEIATDYSRMLGTDPTYDQWEAGRIKWIAGHAEENPQLTGNAHDAAWGDFAALLGALFGLTKPKSTSPAAEKKAGERAKKIEALLEKYEGKKAWDLRHDLGETFKVLAKNPENKDAKKLNKELETVLKHVTSEENKAHGEQLKALRAEVKEKAQKCTDIEKLEAVRDILDEYTDIAYTIEE